LSACGLRAPRWTRGRRAGASAAPGASADYRCVRRLPITPRTADGGVGLDRYRLVQDIVMSRAATQAFVEKMKSDAACRERVMAVEDVDASVTEETLKGGRLCL
jgi:hypothetical protein